MGAELLKAEFLIEPDGPGVIAADLQLQLGKTVFPGKGDKLRHQCAADAPAPVGF